MTEEKFSFERRSLTPFDVLNNRVNLMIWMSAILYVICLCIVMVILYIFHLQGQIEVNALRASQHEACTSRESLKDILRAEREGKIVQTKKFIAEHPDGIPGISAALLQDGLREDEVILSTLKAESC